MADTPLSKSSSSIGTPKICTNGLFHQNDNPNSSTYFNRVRKQSAGSTPFAIYDDTISSSTSTDATLPLRDYDLEDTPKMSNNNHTQDQNDQSKSLSTSYRRKLDFPKTKAKKKATPPPASVHPMTLRRSRKNQN